MANRNSENISILLNSGNGTFGAAVNYAVDNQPYSIYASDLDGDGDMDLAAAISLFVHVSILENHGNGTFQAAGDFEVGGAPNFAFVADLDGDGDMDMATANIATDNISILINIAVPHVILVSPPQNALDIQSSSNISATFDVDLNPASVNSGTFLAAGSQSGFSSGSISYDSLSRIATFGPATEFSPGEVVTATLTTGILSWDGTPLDSAFSWSFTIHADTATADFDTTEFTPADTGVYWVVAADFDGDTDNDLAAVETAADLIGIFLNDGTGLFTHGSDLSTGDGPATAAAADLDGDGDVDLAVADSGSYDLAVFLNAGDATFGPAIFLSTGGPTWGVVAVDFDGDGDQDLAASTGDSGTVVIFLNNGDGTFPASPSQVLDAGSGAFNISICDPNGDFHPDLTVSSGGPSSVKTFINDGGGGFPPTPSGSYDTEGSSWGLFSADLDGDGKPDLAVSNKQEGSLTILLNNGEGAYPEVSGSYDTEGSAWGLFGGDFDGDGDIDLAISGAESGSVKIFINNGDSTFYLFGSYDTEGSSWGLFAADLNGDGTVDLAVGNTESDGVTELFNTPAPPGPPPCPYQPGDINANSFANGIDVVYGVNYLKGGAAPPDSCDCRPEIPTIPFYGALDVNGNCMANGIDITYFVSYLKGIQPTLLFCSDCPPAGRDVTPPAPAAMPVMKPALKTPGVPQPTQ